VQKGQSLSRQCLMDRKKLQQACICINARNVRTTIWCCLWSLYECVVCRNIKRIFIYKSLIHIYICMHIPLRFLFFFLSNTALLRQRAIIKWIKNWRWCEEGRRRRKKEEKKIEKKENRMIVNIHRSRQ
jgi:hypothetical protein